MKKELKELIKVLEQEDTRRQLLEEKTLVEMKRMLKEPVIAMYRGGCSVV